MRHENPFPKMITDEVSGVEVRNQRWGDWLDGYSAGYDDGYDDGGVEHD